MDRNPGAAAGEYRGRTVALRKEGVDRNINQGKETRDFSRVALRKESVDRNHFCAGAVNSKCRVALRKESVDRNWLWNVSLSDCSGWFCSCGYPL